MKNNNDSKREKVENEIRVVHPRAASSSSNSKRSSSKSSDKIYKVTVTYVEVSEEEARIKMGILERILKSSYRK